MGERFIYIDVEHAVNVHDLIIENTGGSSGNNNLGLLDSPLEHIKNDMRPLHNTHDKRKMR